VKRLLLAVLLLVLACSREQKQQAAPAAIGDSVRGGAAIERFGCAACHIIPGIKGTNGTIGPSLEHFAQRHIIAGKFPNNPQMLVKWLQNPPAFDPQSAMPNLGISPRDAHDIAAFLFTLK